MTRLTRTALAAALLTCLTLPIAAFAGAVGGPKRTDENVLARSTDRYTIRFRAGEDALVIARGDGDIDLEISDENGNVIAEDRDADNTPLCTFRPRWTGPFTVRVINTRSYAIDYTLVTN